MSGTPAAQYARSADGTHIAFTSIGVGPPLLFVGAGINQFTAELASPRVRPWYDVLGRDRTLLLSDMRGFGLSERDVDDYSIDALVADLRAVIDSAGEDQINLVANYRSTPAAIEFTARYPERVRRLILIDPYADGARFLSQPLTDTVAGTMRGDWRSSLAVIARFSGAPNEQMDEMVAALEEATDEADYRRLTEAVPTWDVTPSLSKVEAPTLVIHFSENPFVPIEFPREVAAGIDGARLTVLTGSPGVLIAQDPKPLSEMIDGFLSDRAETTGLVTAGLQTILFTDLAGSTAMQSRLGDHGARDVLRAHDAAVRQALSEFNGREVKHTGDGMMTTFGSAADAVSCALTVRRDIETYNDTHEGEELLVRFGINAGEPIAEDDDLFGLSVTLAARIGDWGEPGQVLCSNVVRELLLGKGFEFTSVGEAELKGFDEPVPLYEVRG